MIRPLVVALVIGAGATGRGCLPISTAGAPKVEAPYPSEPARLNFRLASEPPPGGPPPIAEPGQEILNGPDPYSHPLVVQRRVAVSGYSVCSIRLGYSDRGAPVIDLSLDRTGSRQLADVTTANLGRTLAVVFDDKVIVSPVLTTPITGGRLYIDGGMSLSEVNQTIATLRTALPNLNRC